MKKAVLKQKVLVTGASGFVGSHVAKALAQGNFIVYGLVRPGANLYRLSEEAGRIRIIDGDLEDRQRMRTLLRRIQPDICCHFAWHMGQDAFSSLNNLDSLNQSISLLQLLAKTGCKKFIGAGSASEYRPMGRHHLSENDLVRGSSLYAASKIAFLTVLQSMATQKGMDYLWLRLFNLYGPYENEYRLVPLLCNALLKGRHIKLNERNRKLDYLHVADAASAVKLALEKHVTGVLNIASGRCVSVEEITRRVTTLSGKKAPISYAAEKIKHLDLCADNTRLIKELKWKPMYDLDHGLSQTIEWWQGQCNRLSII